MKIKTNKVSASVPHRKNFQQNKSDKVFMLLFLIIFGLCFLPFALKSHKENPADLQLSVKSGNMLSANECAEDTTITVKEKPSIKFNYSDSPTLAADALISDSALLYDATTNTILYNKNHDKICFPASTTKIMTAYVALKYMPFDSQFTVGTELSLLQPDSSLAYLSAGNIISLEDLLYAMLLPSGNDAAYVTAVNVARSVSGNPALSDTQAVEYFSNLMNKEAENAGAKNTNFCDPDGYHNEFHYTTAEDLLKISIKALEYPILSRIVSEPHRQTKIISGEDFFWSNGNCLVVNDNGYFLPFATGFKTGFTDEAGYCMVATANSNGHQLIAVTLNSPTLAGRYTDAANLFYSVISPEKVKPPAPVQPQQ